MFFNLQIIHKTQNLAYIARVMKIWNLINKNKLKSNQNNKKVVLSNDQNPVDLTEPKMSLDFMDSGHFTGFLVI